jgi:hypothetical protein
MRVSGHFDYKGDCKKGTNDCDYFKTRDEVPSRLITYSAFMGGVKQATTVL